VACDKRSIIVRPHRLPACEPRRGWCHFANDMRRTFLSAGRATGRLEERADAKRGVRAATLAGFAMCAYRGFRLLRPT